MRIGNEHFLEECRLFIKLASLKQEPNRSRVKGDPMSSMLITPATETPITQLAEVLFTSPLQASDHPSPDQVRTAIDDRLRTCHGDHAECAGCVAQEAGDHPETYMARMRWALSAATLAYPSRLVAA
jgi:hypothetical protein